MLFINEWISVNLEKRQPQLAQSRARLSPDLLNSLTGGEYLRKRAGMPGACHVCKSQSVHNSSMFVP